MDWSKTRLSKPIPLISCGDGGGLRGVGGGREMRMGADAGIAEI